jgi:hypothetical protein
MILSALTSQPILAALTSAAVVFDPIAVKHSCVNEDGSTLTPGVPVHLANINTASSEQTILLKPIRPTTVISGNDGYGITSMCIFHRWTVPLEDKQNKKGYDYALGRSLPRVPAYAYGDYTGSIGDWARPPGLVSQQVKYICGEAINSVLTSSKGNISMRSPCPQHTSIMPRIKQRPITSTFHTF